MGITSPEKPDDEPLGWLPQSYHQMDLQERLVKGLSLRPTVSGALWTGLTGCGKDRRGGQTRRPQRRASTHTP